MAEGVLLMAHGVARDLDDIPRYYAHIRGGRPLDPRVQAELEERYRRIGGHSPLLEITSALAGQVEEQLASRHGAGRYRVYVGYRHCPPYIADAVAAMADDGVVRATAIVLAPHYSDMSVGAYVRAGEDAIRGLSRPMELRYVSSWHLEPSLIALLADRVREGLDRLAEPETTVLFTAHSLPESILAHGDPYPEQVRATGEAVAATLGLRRYGFAWQSAGRTREPWLGPDVLQRIRELAHAGEPAVLVCPVGFVSDHLEVLYDLDVEARDVAAQAGIKWGRTRSLNDDVRFAAVIADVVEHGDARTADETRVGTNA